MKFILSEKLVPYWLSELIAYVKVSSHNKNTFGQYKPKTRYKNQKKLPFSHREWIVNF